MSHLYFFIATDIPKEPLLNWTKWSKTTQKKLGLAKEIHRKNLFVYCAGFLQLCRNNVNASSELREQNKRSATIHGISTTVQQVKAFQWQGPYLCDKRNKVYEDATAIAPEAAAACPP
jgi:hypothetical protein